MSDRVTFKNASISDGGRGITIYARNPGLDFRPLGTFLHDEWDTVVTFTRKPRPIAVGDKVQTTSGDRSGGTVLSLLPYPDGKNWAWVHWRSDVPPSTILTANLEHVGKPSSV